jgi:hypothetical protein
VSDLEQARHVLAVVAILGLIVGERGENDDLAGQRRRRRQLLFETAERIYTGKIDDALDPVS